MCTYMCTYMWLFSFKMDPPPSPPFDPTDDGSSLRRNKVPRVSREHRAHLNRQRELDAMVQADQAAWWVRQSIVQRERAAMSAEDESWLERQID
jgi:hypothetical protein